MHHDRNTRSAITDALRAAADRIDTMPDVPLPATSVEVNISMYRPSSTLAETVQAVDLMVYALTGDTGTNRTINDSGEIHYGTAHDARSLDDVRVSVVTVLDAGEIPNRVPAAAGGVS